MKCKIINSSSQRLFSVFQFSILIIILFHQTTHVHPTLTSLLDNSRGGAVHMRWVGLDEKSFASNNENLKEAISNIALYEFGVDFSDGPEETTLGSTDTTVDVSDLPETTSDAPEEQTNGSAPTTVVPVNPGDDEDENIYWYERPEGYITLGVIGFVSLVGIGSAVFFICKKKMAIQAIHKAKLLPNIS